MDNKQTNNPNPPVRNLDQELEEKKTREFERKLAALQEEYDRVIVPIFNYSTFGVMPDLIYMKRSDHQKMLQQGMQAASAAQNGVKK